MEHPILIISRAGMFLRTGVRSLSYDTHQLQIEQLAHQIWESEGRPEGQQTRHWRMAEELAQLVNGDLDSIAREDGSEGAQD